MACWEFSVGLTAQLTVVAAPWGTLIPIPIVYYNRLASYIINYKAHASSISYSHIITICSYSYIATSPTTHSS